MIVQFKDILDAFEESVSLLLVPELEPMSLKGVCGGGQEGDVFEGINIAGNEAALFPDCRSVYCHSGSDRWSTAEGFDQSVIGISAVM